MNGGTNTVNPTHLLMIDYIAKLEKKVANLEFINTKWNEYTHKVECRNDFLEVEITRLEDKVEEYQHDVIELQHGIDRLSSYNAGLKVKMRMIAGLIP
jgi:chaperonin cofactor prefoldin